jgi:ribosomal protein S18 acetylase RimI-like enzyme
VRCVWQLAKHHLAHIWSRSGRAQTRSQSRVPTVGELTYRPPTEQDHRSVLAALDTWWDDRHAAARRAALLPRLFFQHFTNTSLVIIDEDGLVGFLIGFLSQSQTDEAYIHFVGIDPRYRGQGLGADLYERFFAIARMNRRHMVCAITSASNTGSQAFHRRLGFSVSDPITDYDGTGGAHVTFAREL